MGHLRGDACSVVEVKEPGANVCDTPRELKETKIVEHFLGDTCHMAALGQSLDWERGY